MSNSTRRVCLLVWEFASNCQLGVDIEMVVECNGSLEVVIDITLLSTC